MARSASRAQAVAFVFSVARPESLTFVSEAHAAWFGTSTPAMPVALVANMSDLGWNDGSGAGPTAGHVSFDEAAALADAMGMTLMITSALTGDGVDSVFVPLVTSRPRGAGLTPLMAAVRSGVRLFVGREREGGRNLGG